eukprot:7510700-Pyramimonas_sp.AAC.1
MYYSSQLSPFPCPIPSPSSLLAHIVAALPTPSYPKPLTSSLWTLAERPSPSILASSPIVPNITSSSRAPSALGPRRSSVLLPPPLSAHGLVAPFEGARTRCSHSSWIRALSSEPMSHPWLLLYITT